MTHNAEIDAAAVLAALLAEEPEPLSSPVALARFHRKARERGLGPDYFATNPTARPTPPGVDPPGRGERGDSPKGGPEGHG